MGLFFIFFFHLLLFKTFLSSNVLQHFFFSVSLKTKVITILWNFCMRSCKLRNFPHAVLLICFRCIHCVGVGVCVCGWGEGMCSELLLISTILRYCSSFNNYTKHCQFCIMNNNDIQYIYITSIYVYMCVRDLINFVSD